MNYYLIKSTKKHYWVVRSETLLPVDENNKFLPGVDGFSHLLYIFALNKKLQWAIGQYSKVYICHHSTDPNDFCNYLAELYKDKPEWIRLSTRHNIKDFQQFIASTV